MKRTFLVKQLAWAGLGIMLLISVSGCGNSGGGATSSDTSPYIYAEMDSLAGSNSAASVYVIDDFNGNPITHAMVTVNGVTLTYNATYQAYQGYLTVSPGDSVILNVTVSGNTYTATGNQFTSYPAISAPASGDTWPIRCYNRVAWSSEVQTADAFYGLGVLDAATGELVWPSGGFLQTLPITATSYSIHGSNVTVGNRQVIVGIAKSVAFSNAAPGSEFIISGFNSVPITVADFTPPPVGISVTPSTPGIALRTTQQFTATATYCDSLSEDITASVTWYSSDTGVATISNEAGSQGMASAVSGGAATITATLGAVSGSATLSVYPYYNLPINSIYPVALAIGDVTGDGKSDVVVITNYDAYPLYLYAQNATGGLSSPLAFATSGSYGYSPHSVAIGDINGDGLNEVVVAHSGMNIEVFAQDGVGGLVSNAIYTTVNSTQTRIADLNHDGRLDVVGIGWGGNTADVFLQNVSGTLNSPVTYAVDHAGWDDLEAGDVNNDGWIDIIVKSGQGLFPKMGVLTQKADGTFNAAVYYAPGGGNIGVGDVNGDGRNDVVTMYGGMCVLAQNTGGTLNPAACYSTYSGSGAIDVGDVNADGRKDVALVHYGWNALGIYFQAADGSLSAEQLYTIPYGVDNPHALAIGDINNDGINDIVTLDRYKGLIVFVP